ncbi:MAG: glycosyltransferase family 4 protein [Synergistaceae bacterium]|nr:glycosyltransferase family 4 protein [Synergistaceae bacterium]
MMRMIQILPELDIGGVERHVIDLSNELAERGHDILVISNGGQMQRQLSGKVLHRSLPVHKKNPFTAWSCSGKISSWIRKEGWELIHAHSRVPAWIAWRTSSKANVPWIYTAHACYSLNYGLIPLKHAKFVISVSETVRDHIKDYLPEKHIIIPAALPEPTVKWDPQNRGKNRFIFVGRLTKIKGLSTVIEALGKLKNENWTLDVLGDGPEREELEKRSVVLGLNDKITFHGYSEEADSFMSRSSCLLFPSHSEGYGLVLARAAQIGLPVIASNIPTVLKMAGSKEGLVDPGDSKGWQSAIVDFLYSGRSVVIPVFNIHTLKSMVDSSESIYFDLICK